MYQKFIIIGNLVRDPELRYTPGGDAVTEFTVACSEKYKDKEKTLFMPVVAWKAQAENICKYLGKGSKVFVDGRIDKQEWEKDGEKKNKYVVQAQTVKFLSPKRDNGQDTGTSGQSLDEQLADAAAQENDLEPF